jgi:hypothetical protein
LVVVLGVLTKRSFLPLLVLVLLAIGVRLRHRVHFLLAAAIAVEVLVGGGLAIGSQQRLALWEVPSPTQSFRCSGGMSGGWAICLTPKARSVQQLVPPERTLALRGADLRLGLWVRSMRRSGALLIDVNTDAGKVATRTMLPGAEWERVEMAGRVPPTSNALRVTLWEVGDGAVKIDDVVLERQGEAPVGDGYVAAAGEVDGVARVRNELVNGSGEIGQLTVPRWLPESIQRSLSTVIDSATGVLHEKSRVLRSSLRNRVAVTFGMFWGTTGWPTPPPLFPVALQWGLAVLTAAAVLGALVGLMRRSTPASVAVMLVSVLAVGIAVLARNFPYDDSPVTSGRYLFPGLVAIVTVFAAGWRHFWPRDDRSFRNMLRLALPGVHALFAVFVFVPFLTR